MTERKMVGVRLTDNPDVNRKVLPPEFVALLDAAKDLMDAKLVGFKVAQGSPEAEAIEEITEAYKKRQARLTSD
jgi:hypothetical protein